MKVGIISDTHDNRANVLKAIEVFSEQRVEYIFHAGDMTSPATAQLFAAVEGAKFIAVFGNCDCNRVLLEDMITGFGGEIYEGSYKGRVGGKRVFMTHQPNNLESAIASGEYDLVIYGHTHKRDIRKVGDITVINPGKSKSRLLDKPEVVILEFDDMSAKEVRLN